MIFRGLTRPRLVVVFLTFVRSTHPFSLMSFVLSAFGLVGRGGVLTPRKRLDGSSILILNFILCKFKFYCRQGFQGQPKTAPFIALLCLPFDGLTEDWKGTSIVSFKWVACLATVEPTSRECIKEESDL